ncbi:hypothetical protein GCM10022222_63500 [Amycolatopsis ultiminotia]|uniref:LysM domain-containing protein n=1 Tax=Amycolatopsis ultiminotia TaxID=543629 RepID=A0ABP6XRY7_9PSEU
MTATAAQRIRGALAALALLAFVAGVPCGFLALGADPSRLLPDRWPDPVPISQWPGRIWTSLRWAWLTGDLVLWLVVAAAWAGWLLLTVSVVVEVIRQTRQGVRTARGLLNRVPRGRWIAGLVAAVLIAASAGTAAASGLPAAPVAATAPPWPDRHRATPEPRLQAATVSIPDAATGSDQQHGQHVVPYVVVHGDTLWGLAQRHLGQGIRYHEIVQLNPSLRTTPDELEPGWTLQLPEDAVGLPRPAETAPTGRTVDVVPGDTLTGIAERELGNPYVWRTLFDLNAGRVQPDGRALRDPSQLLPGWQLHLPVASPFAEPHEQRPAAEPVPLGPPRSTAPRPNTNSSSPKSAHDTRPTAEQVSLPGGGLVGLGLALSVFVLLYLARRRRRARRTPTGCLMPPADVNGAEALPPGAAVATLATAAHHADLDEDEADSSRTIDVVARNRRVWPPPAPVLTAYAGTTTQSADLGESGGLVLAGPGAASAARAVLAAVLAVDARYPTEALLASPETAQLIAGFPGQTSLHEAPGVEIVDDETTALAKLNTVIAQRVRLRDTDQFDADVQPDTRSASQHAAPVPLLLVLALPSAQHHREWAAVGALGSDVGVHILLLGDDDLHNAGFAGLTVDADGTVQTARGEHSIEVGARTEVLSPAEADELWRLLASARGPTPHPATDTEPHDLDDPDELAGDPPPDSTEATAAPAVLVRLLGGVRVETRGNHVPGLRARAREVLA